MQEKVSQLRQKLGNEAKQEPKFRLYAWYDRIYRTEVLEAAWEQVRRRAGAPLLLYRLSCARCDLVDKISIGP